MEVHNDEPNNTDTIPNVVITNEVVANTPNEAVATVSRF